MTICQKTIASACIFSLTIAYEMGAKRKLPSEAASKSVDDRGLQHSGYIQEGHLGTDCVHM